MGPAAEGWMGQTVVGQKRAPALSNRPENRSLMGAVLLGRSLRIHLVGLPYSLNARI